MEHILKKVIQHEFRKGFAQFVSCKEDAKEVEYFLKKAMLSAPLRSWFCVLP